MKNRFLVFHIGKNWLKTAKFWYKMQIFLCKKAKFLVQKWKIFFFVKKYPPSFHIG